MRRVMLKWIPRLALGAAAGLLLIAFGIDRFFSREVLLIAPHDEATVKLNRSLYVPGDPVAEIYGNPLSRPVHVIVFRDARIIRPVEDPSQLLMPVEDALQTRTVWFVTRYGVGALLLIAIVTYPASRR
jgi:hypothetical protein